MLTERGIVEDDRINAEELDKLMHDLDALLSVVSEEIDMDNRKLESRLKNVSKSRMLLDRFYEALRILENI